jgi:dTDP-4-dehydrorhamnose reductase
MTALVIGASGQVGKSLVRLLRREAWEVVGTYHSRKRGALVELDIRNEKAVQELIRTTKPAMVFLPAALVNADYCEEHPDEARAVNVAGAIHVADEACRVGAKFIFFSSDYVFDGLSGPYDEDDEPRPLSVYGQAKLQVEEYVKRLTASHLIIRTAWVFGYDKDSLNFAMQVYGRLTRGAPVVAPEDQVGNPTFVDELAEMSLELARKDFGGTVHVAGRDLVSRFEFARRLAGAFGFDRESVRPVATAALGQRARRPLRGGLKTEKLRRVLGRETMALDQALRELRQRWPESSHA